MTLSASLSKISKNRTNSSTPSGKRNLLKKGSSLNSLLRKNRNSKRLGKNSLEIKLNSSRDKISKKPSRLISPNDLEKSKWKLQTLEEISIGKMLTSQGLRRKKKLNASNPSTRLPKRTATWLHSEKRFSF